MLRLCRTQLFSRRLFTSCSLPTDDIRTVYLQFYIIINVQIFTEAAPESFML